MTGSSVAESEGVEARQHADPPCCEGQVGSGHCGRGVWRLVVGIEEWRIEDGGTTWET